MNMNAILDVVVGTNSFQELRAYQRSIEFLALDFENIAQLPKGHAELADQLLCAAQSPPATSPRVHEK